MRVKRPNILIAVPSDALQGAPRERQGCDHTARNRVAKRDDVVRLLTVPRIEKVKQAKLEIQDGTNLLATRSFAEREKKVGFKLLSVSLSDKMERTLMATPKFKEINFL